MRTIVASVLLSLSASAQCLDWSRPYHDPGTNETIDTAVYFDDGTGERLCVGGSFTQIGGVSARHVARWNGTKFEPIGAGLGFGIQGNVHRLRVLDVGAGPTLYATMSFPDPHYVYRFDGTSWHPLPGVVGFRDIIAFDDGSGPKVYAAGGGANGRVSRWTGADWETVGGALFDGLVTSLEVFDDGSGPVLLAGGEFRDFNGVAMGGLARWTGSTWLPYAGNVMSGPTDGIDAMAAISWQGSPQLVVAGAFFVAGGVSVSNIARWDGAAWRPLGTGINPPASSSMVIYDVAVVPGPLGPEIAVAGNLAFAGGQPVTGIASWNGTAWSAFGPIVNLTSSQVYVHEIARPSVGTDFVVAGNFDLAGDAAVGGVARWDGSGWQAVDENQSLRGTVECSVVHDDGSGPQIYVGGLLQTAGTDAVKRVARFDGDSWERVGPYVNEIGNVRALASVDFGSGPRLYGGGTFTTFGGAPASRLAVWDGVAWTEAAGGGANSTVEALLHDPIADPGALYAAGSFTTIGGFAAPRVARFDGTSWMPVGAPLNGVYTALAFLDDGSGPRLYAGGTFTGRIARFDGGVWSLLPQGPGGFVEIRALCAFDDGVVPRLFVGGKFSSVGGVSTSNVASWDGASWTTYGAGATGYTGGSVDAFRVFDEGLGGGAKLYAGGRFTTIGGTLGESVLAYDGAGWQPLVPSGGLAGTVSALDALGDVEGSSLYAFGTITPTSSAPARGIARYGRHGLSGCEAVTGASFCDGAGGGAACPCGNTGLAGRGCDNAHATGGALLEALGQANVSTDDVTLRVRGTSPSGATLFFQGTSTIGGGAGVAFGDGVRCVGGTQLRLGVRSAVSGEARLGASEPGDPSVSSAGHLVGAATRTYQAWYRDPQTYCTPSTFNLSNGLRIRWAP